jgi:hypothetical protein
LIRKRKIVSRLKPISVTDLARLIYRSKVKLVMLFTVTIGVIFLAVPTPPKFISDLGLAFVSTGLISIIYELAVRESLLENVKAQLAELIDPFRNYVEEYIKGEFAELAKKSERSNRLEGAGIIDVRKGLSTSELEEAFANASKVEIWQTWVHDLYTLLRRLQPGCCINILLLDPESYLVKLRSKALGFPDETAVISSIQINIEEIKRFYREDARTKNIRIEVRLYNTIPPGAIHAWTDIKREETTVYLGHYLHRRRAIHTKIHVLQGESAQDWLDNFYIVWDESTSLSLDITSVT